MTDGRTGAPAPTPAQQAARQLPDNPLAGGREPTRADVLNAFLMVAVMAAMPLGLAGYLLTRPWGWLGVVIGVPAWLVGRWLFGRLVPDQVVPTVVATPDGRVQVVRGLGAIAAHRTMLDTGARRWFGRGVLLGFLLIVAGMVVGLAGLALFGTDIGVALLSAEVLVAMLAFAAAMYRGTVTPIRLRRKGLRVLDAGQVMPLVGVYAQRFGDDAAAAGVPADQLLAAADSLTAAERDRVMGQLTLGASMQWPRQQS